MWLGDLQKVKGEMCSGHWIEMWRLLLGEEDEGILFYTLSA
jgi:hypothetical protein